MDFLSFFRELWMPALPMQLVRIFLTAALFEILVWVISVQMRKAFRPILARDSAADNTQRLLRHRVVLGIPLKLLRMVLYIIALAIILRILRFKADADIYPIFTGLIALFIAGGWQVLRDVVAGYFIHYDYLYAVGDEITVGEYSGMVSEISLRCTRLRTRDAQEIILSSSEVRTLINRTGLQRRAAGINTPRQ